MCVNKTNAKKYSLVKDVYTPYFEGYIGDIERKLYLEKKHLRAINMSMYCRTGSMGRIVYDCESCGKKHEMYRSCKHRFCAQCGIVETYRWGALLRGKLLNLAHSHVTFTLPNGLRWLGKCCETVVYDCMFKAINEVLQSFFFAKHGIKCGVVMVLHTSGSDLKYHPHIHCIVSCGGVGTDVESGGKYLKSLGDSYLCSHTHLGNQFRIRLIKLLKAACVAGKLSNEYGELMSLSSLNARLGLVSGKSWIVGVEKGLWDSSQIVGYVGRYTKRACISEYKIMDISGGEIAFTFNDYANTPPGAKPVLGTKRQSIRSFLDALLQHVPEKGFQAVRYCGVYANAAMKGLPSSFLAVQSVDNEEVVEDTLPASSEVEQFSGYRKNQIKLYGRDPLVCSCGGQMRFLWMYIEGKRIFGKLQAVKFKDTS